MIPHDWMAPLMFGGLVVFMLIGYPVSFSLAAVGLFFGFIAIEQGLFQFMFMQALPERIFGILFLLPATLILAYLSWPVFYNSWAQGEVSTNAGGLVRWPVYALMPLGFGLLMLQGLSELVKRIAFLRGLIPDPTIKKVAKTPEEELAEELRRQAEAQGRV